MVRKSTLYTITIYNIRKNILQYVSCHAIHPHPWADPTLVEGLRQPPVLGLWPGKAKGRIWTEPWNLKTTHIWKSDLGIRIKPSAKYEFVSWDSYSEYMEKQKMSQTTNQM